MKITSMVLIAFISAYLLTPVDHSLLAYFLGLVVGTVNTLILSRR